jgi:hypothetical protein
VAKFINDLRALRVANPSLLVGDNRTNFDDIFGKYGPYNTYNVDQHPLPFASADPCTLDFIGTERVWIKEPGSGLSKRQTTLQLLVRALGKQPPPCLLFRGKREHANGHWKDLRADEEALYDADVTVLWQAKAWADSAVCVDWARGAFANFVSNAHEDLERDTLVLADNLGAQTAGPFLAAMKEARATMKLGPKGATHVWQPCDHHLGREYGRLMGIYYDEWMASDFENIVDGHVSAAERRILLTKWAGRAYRHLEAERGAAEQQWLADPVNNEPSRFYKAFLRTGCLVTADGTNDDEILPHREIKGELLTKFHSLIYPPQPHRAQGNEWDGLIHLSESESESEGEGDSDCGYNSEDTDDEEAGSDGEQEPVRSGMELQLPEECEVEDEQAALRATRAVTHKDGDEELIRDFRLAARIAREDGVVVAPAFVGVQDLDFNTRKNAIYERNLQAFEEGKGRKATKRQVEKIWNEAGIEATGQSDSRQRRRRARH